MHTVRLRVHRAQQDLQQPAPGTGRERMACGLNQSRFHPCERKEIRNMFLQPALEAVAFSVLITELQQQKIAGLQ